MKLFIQSTFIFVALFFANSVKAQVTLNDLMETPSATENTSKKWISDLNSAETDELAKQIVGVELSKMTKSKHWINLSADGEVTNELSFQTSKKMYVDKMIEKMKEAGFNLTSTKNDNDSKTFLYTRKNITIEVLALSTESTAQTVYLVTLL